MPEAQRYKLTVAYRGTAYHGWQRQIPVEGEELPTVQNVLRLALQRTVGHPVNVVGASRTDAGVHALGQVAHFDTIRTQIPPQRLLLAANAKLPEDIRINTVEPVPPEFDAIGSTIEKAYRYLIHNSPHKDIFRGDLALQIPKPLDTEAMQAAAHQFVGEHDFASFAKPGHGRESTIRRVTAARIERDGDQIRFEVAGTGFLWHQVRIMAGTLIDIGLGRKGPDAIAPILAARDRQSAGPTAAPQGLYLVWVKSRENL